MGSTPLELNKLTAENWAESSGSLKSFFVKNRPNNWRNYLKEILDQAKETGATEIAEIGCGHEAIAFELFHNKKPMWVVLRAQCGSAPVPSVDGLLPFYRDEGVYFSGDPEPSGVLLEPHPELLNEAGDVTHGQIYKRGMRITTMPKAILCKPLINEYGIPLDGVTEEDLERYDKLHGQIHRFINLQGFVTLDNHQRNQGFYTMQNDKSVPVLFDPGPRVTLAFPESVPVGSQGDRDRRRGSMTLLHEGKAGWMDPALWRSMRQEISQDSQKLYNHEPTNYCARMEQLIAGGLTADSIMHSLSLSSSPQR